MERNEEEKRRKKNRAIATVAGTLLAGAVFGIYYYFKKYSPSKEKTEEIPNKPLIKGSKHIWLREETKKGERRTPLTPENAKKMIEAGYQITVEKSNTRIFKDEEYKEVGCNLAEGGSWKEAPLDAIILGLKELPENEDQPLKHTHIFFAHCFKGQKGWKELIRRFEDGKGNLLDLEYLLKEGRRVAAFGATAGMVGAAVGVTNWVHQQLHPELEYPVCVSWDSKEEMIEHVKLKLGDLKPKTIVFGALGRSGRGASEILKAVGLKPVEWDLPETKKGGPFKEILEHDIMYNCILLVDKIPPFVTLEMVKEDENRKLTMICDVSCDNSNPNNPIPFLNTSTTLDHPVVNLYSEAGKRKLDGIAIDHLPTLLPRESSITFSNDLLPYLFELKEYSNSPVWKGAEDVFNLKKEESKK